jgi:hypothetical protein
MAPSIVGGNPCAVGATTGLSLPGFGIVGGGTWEGKGCERRQLAALLYNMGHDLPPDRGQPLQLAAVEVLCANDDVRGALKRVGQPCSVDRPAAPAVAAAPVPAAAGASAVAEEIAQRRPEWCYTASPAERRSYAACNARS